MRLRELYRRLTNRLTRELDKLIVKIPGEMVFLGSKRDNNETY